MHPRSTPPRWKTRGGGPGLTALLLPQIFPILHPTVHKTHGGGPALRSSRRSAGVPTARTVRRGVDQRGASPPSVLRRTFTTGCSPGSIHGVYTAVKIINLTSSLRYRFNRSDMT